MKQFSVNGSIYAADTAGVCSALYELGGMTIVHDASGCNSTYSTHDEPRWYDRESMIYISALTERDAVTGDDEKLIGDVCEAAARLKPNFVCLCASPMPAMIGTDMDYIAAGIESRTGIPAFAVRTNGIGTYQKGASDAFRAVSRRFCARETEKTPKTVNLLGLTPLDLPAGADETLKALLRAHGYTVQASLGMGGAFDDLPKLAGASVSLVTSGCGLAAARDLYERFGVPYVTAFPVYGKYAELVCSLLATAALTGKCVDACTMRPGRGVNAVAGEGVTGGSLAAALAMETGEGWDLIAPVEGDPSPTRPFDLRPLTDDETRLAMGRYERVVADPLYAPICPPRTKLIELPHVAYSGRCFLRRAPDALTRAGFETILESVK